MRCCKLNKEMKKIIKHRLEKGIQSFDDLDVHKRDLFSYIRELGYEYKYKPTNIDVKNIEWGDYKSIIKKGLLPNYSMARVVRELEENTHRSFGWRTLQYKIKETGVGEKDIKKDEEWVYYLKLCEYEKVHGRDKTMAHFGLEQEPNLYNHSLSEYCYVKKQPLDKVYRELCELKEDRAVRGINACRLRSDCVALPYRNFKLFWNIYTNEPTPSSRERNHWKQQIANSLQGNSLSNIS